MRFGYLFPGSCGNCERHATRYALNIEEWMIVKSSPKPLMKQLLGYLSNLLVQMVHSIVGSRKWEKPPEGFTKCNVASSWVNQSQNGGAAWIARDHLGIPLIHSRRASSPTNSALKTGLSSLLWASEALHDLRFKKVIFEISSPTVWRAINEPRSFPEMALQLSLTLCSLHKFDHCQVLLVSEDINTIAVEIASSVTKDRRYQSYIARGGPSWLAPAIINQART